MSIILGAGISGLSLAYHLHNKGEKILLLEGSHRPGGWIRTSTETGFLFEQGPRSFRSSGSGAATLRLIESLGLSDQLIEADAKAKKRFLFYDGKIQKLGLLNRTILKAIWQDLWTSRASQDDESIDAFFTRRFGARAASIFADAVTSGIFAGDTKTLSIRSCFPHFWSHDQERQSVLIGTFRKKKEKMRLYSFKSGMQLLTNTLASRLEGSIVYNAPIMSIRALKKGIQVTLVDGTAYESEKVYSTLSPHHLGPLLEGPIQEPLRDIPLASVAVVHLGYDQTLLPYKGFGYLIPSGEKQDILGVIFDSCVFPDQNQFKEETRLTVMMGGTRRPELVHLSEEALVTIASEAASSHMGITKRPLKSLVHRAKHAIPQYTLGHRNRIIRMQQIIASEFQGLHLLGSFIKGVSVNDCISLSETTASNTTHFQNVKNI